MRQLFVFTAGDAAARIHLDDSITKPVPSGWLADYLVPDQAQYLKSLLPDGSGFYAWGAVPGIRNIPMWKAMHEGDVVLTVFANRYHYISSVISKVHSAELAKKIWGTDPEGKTWEYIYLLTEPKPVNVEVTSSPVVDYLYNGYRGFTKISDERIVNLIHDFGTLEAFIEHAFQASVAPSLIERELEAAEQEAQANSFDPAGLVDARKKVLAEIVRRRGQPQFRKALLEAYEGKCAVTGCNVDAVLEAAHIISYIGDETNHVSNGLLLRADIHTLFDLGELKIDRTGVIHLSEKLNATIYGELQGKGIRFPADGTKAPHTDALDRKFCQSI